MAQSGDQGPRRVLDLSAADPQRTGIPPLSFVRQVLAVCLHPELLEDAHFPADVHQRARRLLAVCAGGSVGSYCTTSFGFPSVQQSIAQFITRRDGDGVTSCPDDIILSNGSHGCLLLMLHLLAGAGLLIPVPGPHTLRPLLDATGMQAAPYRLSEGRGWALDLDELHRALTAARGHCEPRALYVSNPGNPTGHVQDRKSMEDVIRFAAAERLVLLADEVNQDSVFTPDTKFLSYRKVLLDMDQTYSQTVELVSFHSISSIITGECGLRGGYLEVINMDPGVKVHLKQMQANKSPATLPQLAMEVMVAPPAPGEPSHRRYTEEILQRRETFSHNARRACDFLNSLVGVRCQPAMAGAFLYPRLLLPAGMIEDAKVSGVTPDELYCQRLLQEEGVCVGPGSQNGGGGGDIHIRLCVVAPTAVLDDVLTRVGSFHLRLMHNFTVAP